MDRVVLRCLMTRRSDGWGGGGLAETGGLSSRVSFLVVKRLILKTLLVIRDFVWTSIRGDNLTLNKINARTVGIMVVK